MLGSLRRISSKRLPFIMTGALYQLFEEMFRNFSGLPADLVYGQYDPIYHLRRVYHATERKLFQVEEKYKINDFVKALRSKSC